MLNNNILNSSPTSIGRGLLKFTYEDYIIGIKRNKISVTNQCTKETVYSNTKYKFSTSNLMGAAANNNMLVLISENRAVVIGYNGSVKRYHAGSNTIHLTDMANVLEIKVGKGPQVKNITIDDFSDVVINKHDTLRV